MSAASNVPIFVPGFCAAFHRELRVDCRGGRRAASRNLASRGSSACSVLCPTCTSRNRSAFLRCAQPVHALDQRVAHAGAPHPVAAGASLRHDRNEVKRGLNRASSGRLSRHRSTSPSSSASISSGGTRRGSPSSSTSGIAVVRDDPLRRDERAGKRGRPLHRPQARGFRAVDDEAVSTARPCLSPGLGGGVRRLFRLRGLSLLDPRALLRPAA